MRHSQESRSRLLSFWRLFPHDGRSTEKKRRAAITLRYRSACSQSAIFFYYLGVRALTLLIFSQQPLLFILISSLVQLFTTILRLSLFLDLCTCANKLGEEKAAPDGKMAFQPMIGSVLSYRAHHLCPSYGQGDFKALRTVSFDR